jgi:transcriptional regulator with XRE-family HTH domain
MFNAGRHIPNILRKNRRSKGITQSELARFLKMKKSNQISLWEKGLVDPSFKNALLFHFF